MSDPGLSPASAGHWQPLVAKVAGDLGFWKHPSPDLSLHLHVAFSLCVCFYV